MYHIIVLIFIPFVLSFNIDTNFPIVYKDFTYKVSNKSSYFGYSLVLYPEKHNSSLSWIYIGAPRGENSKLFTFTNPGVFFKCEIKNLCMEIDINEHYNSSEHIKLDNAWIGGSMDVSYKYERIVTCAHRWIKITKSGDYRMRGSCYWFQGDGSNIRPLIPFNMTGKDKYKSNNNQFVYLYGQGQAGTSVHTPSGRPEILMGAPGVYNWDGTSILYKDVENSKPVAFGIKNIADTVNTTETLAFDLLGYASTSGYFYKEKKLYYVSGAPKSDNYRGKVLIYTFFQMTNRHLEVKESRSGNQFGEYFGSALSAGDINNDGYDDLIVGAPFHATKNYNEGKVYIFLGGKTLSSLENAVFLFGNNTNGQFGTCVQYLGDINSDGFGDIIVSAPYEDEKSGVIYLYRGTSFGIDTKYCQRIVGRDIFPKILGFGIIVSRAADIDYNKFSDVAVGAYISGHVVILRTYPVVAVYQNLSTFSSHLNPADSSFNISACFWFSMDQPVPKISIKRILKVGELKRAELQDAPSEEIISLVQSTQFCQNFTIILKFPFLSQTPSSDQHEPITVSLMHKLVTKQQSKQVIFISTNGTNKSDAFCPTCPAYDKIKSTSLSILKIPFAIECGSDNICNSSLEFESVFADLGKNNIFVLGSTDTITLRTLVNNLGENAYLTRITFTLPDAVIVRNIPSNCVQQNFSLKCSLGNPLRTNQPVKITLNLDMTKVNDAYYDDCLHFLVTIQTSSVNRLHNSKQLNITLQREADITINRISNEENYSYKTSEHKDLNLVHIYSVETFGISSLNDILIEVDVPRYIKNKEDNLIEIIHLYPVRGKLEQQESFTCDSDFTYIDETNIDTDQTGDEMLSDIERKKRSLTQIENLNEEMIQKDKYDIPLNRTFYINCTKYDIKCTKLRCVLGSIKPRQIAKVKISMLLNISVITNFLNDNDIILFTTRGRVKITNPSEFRQNGDRSDIVEITSIIIGENVKEVIPLWIVLLSVITGLLLLLLLILCLIKVGFFNRKTKKKLEQLMEEYKDGLVEL